MTLSTTDMQNAQERCAEYWTTLRDQKERKSVREILEREVLLTFIRTNQERINEYPLLVPQQQSIIDFITTRAQGHPLHEHTANSISNFITTLNQYGNLTASDEHDAAAELVPTIHNLEAILLKTIQGVVYTTALTIDNFSEVLIRYFGEEALKTIDAIMEEVQLGPQFWKDHFEHFIGTQIDAAYDDTVSNGNVHLTKENGALVIRYAFDDVLTRLNQTDKTIEKTRIQELHLQNGDEVESRASQEMLVEFLHTQSRKSDYPFAQGDIELISQIVCMDVIGKQFGEAYTVVRTEKTDDTSEMTTDNAQFVCEQVLAFSCASAVSLGIMRRDFLQSLSMFESRETATIGKMLGTFDIEAIRKAFFAMLEFQFLTILRQKAGDDIGKMQLRIARERRISEQNVEALFDKGMNRIRKNKIWKKDPSLQEQLLFRVASPKELKKLIDILQLEPPLVKELILLWENAGYKVSIGVFLNMDLISRTTTNLNQRLSEIMKKFGISPQKPQ